MTPFYRVALAAVLLALAAPAQAQWELLPTPRRLNNAPLPAATFTTFNGVIVGAFDLYNASDGCAECWTTFASSDEGQTWTLVRDPDGALFSMGSFDRRDGALYATHGYPVDEAHAGRAYRSTDGVSWTLAAPATGVSSLNSVQVTADGALWAGGYDAAGRGIVERSQGGSPWADATGEIGGSFAAPSVATATRIFARTPPALYVREASGGPWTAVPYFPSGPMSMDDDGETLYAGITITRSLPVPPFFTQSFLHRSTDGGTTWEPVASFPPMQADGVWTGTGGSVVVPQNQSDPAIAVSLDAGATWASVPQPVPNGSTDVARVEGGYLYALSDRKLYRYPVSGLNTAAESVPGTEALALSVGPNPARASLALRFSLAEAQTVRVSLTDVLGRTVLTLDRALPAGAAALGLDVSGLAPGVYVARLEAAGASASVRFTVAR